MCSDADRERLRFLYEEWAHPYFVSKEEYGRLMQQQRQVQQQQGGGGDDAGAPLLEDVEVADWTAPTIDSWRHSIWVGVWDPWIVVFKVGLGWGGGFIPLKPALWKH